MTAHAYHTAAQFARIDQGIIEALQGEKWLSIKQIKRKLKEQKIYASGQCIRRRCEHLEGSKIESLDYNSGTSGRQCYRLRIQ